MGMESVKKISEETRRVIARCKDQRFFSCVRQATRAQSSLGDRSFIMTRGEGRGGRHEEHDKFTAHTEIREIPPGGTLVLGTRGRDTSWPPAGIKGCEYHPGLPDVVHPLRRTIGPRSVASSRFVGKGGRVGRRTREKFGGSANEPAPLRNYM